MDDRSKKMPLFASVFFTLASGRHVRTACACRQSCVMDTATAMCSSDDSNCCMEGIAACAQHIRRVDGLAVLERNSVYRMADIVTQAGIRWRLDSMTILCAARYRGTALRTMLQRTVQLANTSRLLVSMEGSATETEIARRGDDGAGTALLVGRSGPSGIILAASEEANIRALAAAVAEKAARGKCECAASNELVVHVRMGDFPSNYSTVVAAIEKRLVPSMTSIVFNMVLHYGYNVWQGSTPEFARTAKRDMQNLLLRDQLLAYFHQTGLGVRVRSDPDADGDLCYLVQAPNVVTGARGFGTLVSRLRTRLQLHQASACSRTGTS